MTRDERIDILLKTFGDGMSYFFYNECERIFNEESNEQTADHVLLFKEMLQYDLLEDKDGYRSVITPNGKRVLEDFGGWIAYKKDGIRKSKKLKFEQNLGLYSNIILGIFNAGILIYSAVREYKTDDKVEKLKSEFEQIKKSSKAQDSLIRLLKTKPSKDSSKIQKSP